MEEKITRWMRSILNHSKLAKLGADQGFTLIEMVIVITIIGLIAGLVGTNVMKRYQEAQIKSTQIQMKTLGTVLDDFKRVCGFYPTTDMGLDALVHKPAGRDCKNYDPDGFIKKVPNDAWDHPFGYFSDGDKYQLKSLGKNGTEGEGNINSDDL